MSSSSPCGCYSSDVAAAAAPAAPENPAYLTLGSVTAGKVLVVPAGTDDQRYLKAEENNVLFSGMMVTEDGATAKFTRTPKITLPVINPKVGASYPLPANFPFLLVSDVDGNWKFMAAPTTGDYYIRSQNGAIKLVDAQNIPGLDTISASNTYVNQGALLTPYIEESGEITLRKLFAEDGKVLVGRQDGTGGRYYEPLASNAFLKHEQIQALKFFHTSKFEQFIPDTDNLETDGLPYVIDGVNDNYPISYSVSGRRFFLSKPRTIESSSPAATDVAVADNGAFQSMGVHGILSNISLSTKNILVMAMVRIFNDAGNYIGIDFGLFVNGALVYTWPVKGGADNNLTHVHKGLGLGTNTVEIRFRQTAGAGATAIKESNMDLICI